MYTPYHNKIPPSILIRTPYGATINEVTDTIIKNVTTNYPPTSPVLKGLHSKDPTRHYKALEFLIEALGQFLGEGFYIPDFSTRTDLERLLKLYTVINEDNKIYTINENDKAHINKMLSLFNAESPSKPGVETHVYFLYTSYMCVPFPKYTFGAILDIPQPDALEEIARRTKISQEETEVINRENQAKNKKILRYRFLLNGLKNVAVVVGAIMGGIFASPFLFPSEVEKLVGGRYRKYLIPMIAIAGIIGDLHFIDYLKQKRLNNPVIPQAFPRTYNLKKYYLELPFRGHLESYNGPWEYNACVETVEDLKALISGKDPNLVKWLPDKTERSLYIKFTQSYCQTIYRMITNYPQIWGKVYVPGQDDNQFDNFFDKCYRATEEYTNKTIKNYAEPNEFPDSKITYEDNAPLSSKIEKINSIKSLTNSRANKMSA